MYTHPIPGIKYSALFHEGTRWYVCEVEAHAVVILIGVAQTLTGRLVSISRKYVRMVLQPVKGAVHSTAFKLSGGKEGGGGGRGGDEGMYNMYGHTSLVFEFWFEFKLPEMTCCGRCWLKPFTILISCLQRLQ